MSDITTDEKTKAELQESAQYYKGEIQKDLEEILGSAEKILKGALIGGSIALVIYLIFKKPSKSEYSDAEDLEDDADSSNKTFLGSIGHVIWERGSELLTVWLLNEVKRRLKEYLDNLSTIETDPDNEETHS